jgi:hypothetical protein
MAAGSTTLVTEMSSRLTGEQRHGRQIVSRGGRLVSVEQFDEVGRRCRRRDADQLEVRCIAGRELPRIKRGMASLAVTPHREAVGGAAVRHVTGRAHRVEHRSPFALAD